MSNAHPGRILPQDTLAPDGAGAVLSAQPISQAEIEDLLYGDDRPVDERIERFRELAASLREQESADFGDGDPATLVGEIEEAIARLAGSFDAEQDVAFDGPTMIDDPLNHRETLAPDSDELEAIEEDDEASLSSADEPLEDSALDLQEWSEDDGFHPARGVR
jgi:hypothetical protein